MIICGTSRAGKSPGMVVPSSEQKQSGSTHCVESQGGALLGSLSMSAKTLHRRNSAHFIKLDCHFATLNITSLDCKTGILYKLTFY